MESIPYNVGYRDGKAGRKNFAHSRGFWIDVSVQSYNDGYLRGDIVRKTLKSRLVQGELFDVNHSS